MLLSAVSVHCHIGEIVSFFSLLFFDFLPEGWVGVNPELRVFTFLEPFPNWYFRQVYSAADISPVGDIELS